MKKITALLLTLFLCSCAGNSVDQLNAPAPKSFVIDVRSVGEYEAGHLADAINIPHRQIEEKVSMYVKDFDSEIILYCQSGGRSGFAQQVLLKMGYKNAVNAGGYELFKSQGCQ